MLWKVNLQVCDRNTIVADDLWHAKAKKGIGTLKITLVRWEKDDLLAYLLDANPIETPFKKEVARKLRSRIIFFYTGRGFSNGQLHMKQRQEHL